MWNNDRQPLPDWIEDAYAEIAAEIEERQEGLTPAQARELLVANDLEAADAGHAIERLLERGYLYEVGEELFVTEPEE